MKFKTFLLVLFTLVMCFGYTRNARTIERQSDAAKARRNAWNLIPMLVNELMYDVDSICRITSTMDSLYIVRDSAVFTKLQDDQGLRHLGLTKKFSITAVADFDTSEDNETAQAIVLDSLPALARLMDCWVICTDSVLDEIDSTNRIFTVEIGTASGAKDIVDSTACDADDNIAAMSATEIFDIAPQNAKRAIFMTGIPDTNWIYLERGSWDVYIQFIDNESY